MPIAFIPARGGSKSIPLKNIKPLNGKPLIYWSIKAAYDSGVIDSIVVATDSKKIARTVSDFEFPNVSIYNRSKKSASDTASTESVMLEYINNTNLSDDELFILIQATSPLTQAQHFKEALEYYEKDKLDSLLTGVRSKRFYWNLDGSPINYNPAIRPRRQDFNGVIVENGAFYISTIGNIKNSKNRLSGKIGIYEMPEETYIEIDEPEDWEQIENIIKKNLSKNLNTPDIKLFLSDVDGTLTDSGMYYSENGDELKKFSTYDGKGFELLRHKHIRTGLITSENTKLVEDRAKKLKIDYLFQGVSGKDKLHTAKSICTKLGIDLSNIAYIGDDINCIELLSNVGFAACPINARPEVKRLPNITLLNSAGGNGAVREFVDIILSNQVNR